MFWDEKKDPRPLYYTEYPCEEFHASSDAEALKKTKAKIVYRESNTPDGRPFIMLREEKQ
jgi:hypothetical protein